MLSRKLQELDEPLAGTGRETAFRPLVTLDDVLLQTESESHWALHLKPRVIGQLIQYGIWVNKSVRLAGERHRPRPLHARIIDVI
jgi:hypothetical protein